MEMAEFGDPRLPDDFWDRASPEPNTGCWLWIGAIKRNRGGYGQYGRGSRAHGVAYRALIGPIPAGLVPDHLCRQTCCVNPSHLEPVTIGVNVLRGEGPTAKNARKTHCKNGHELIGENLMEQERPNGKAWRRCRQCVNARRRQRAAAKKAQGLSRKKVGSKWKWGSRLSSKGATDGD